MLPNKLRGVRRVNDRRVLNGIFWVLRSGAPWRNLPENYGIAALGLLQRLERVADIGVEPGAARVQMRKDRLEHPRIPEFLDVIGNAGHSLVVALALKEFSDLVGHVDQTVRRHGRLRQRLSFGWTQSAGDA